MRTSNFNPDKKARITFEEARRLTRGSTHGKLTSDGLVDILDASIRQQAKFTGSYCRYDIRPAITSTQPTDLIREPPSRAP